LGKLKEQCEQVVEVRQAGLMIGIELETDGSAIVAECLKQGLLINCTHQTVLRLLPAMNISLEQIDSGMSLLTDIVLQYYAQQVQSV
jgi:acetylornithine/succinyldiaminopimelate/putrescine aminotransferase